MAQWAAEVARRGRLTAWLSCEATDNDEGAFLSHLVGALRHLVQSPAELDLAFQSSPIPQLDVVLAALVTVLQRAKLTSACSSTTTTPSRRRR